MDFSFQQTVSHSNAYDIDNDARISRVLELNPPSDPSGYKLLDKPVAGSVYEGLYRNPPQILPHCSTANCAFDGFLSLSICSRYDDIHDLVTVHRSENNTSLLYSLPSGLEAAPVPFNGSSYVFNYSTSIPSSLKSNSYLSSILNLTALTNSSAFECVLYFCVQEYSAVVTDGNYFELVINMWDVPESNSVYQETELDGIHHFNRTTDSKIANFTIVGDVTNQFSAYLSDIFGDLDKVNHSPDESNSLIPAALTNVDSWPTSDALRLTELPDIMDSVAKSLTSALRQGPLGEQFKGHSIIIKIYVTIRWSWFSLPGILIILTFNFFVITLAKSGQDRVPPWKDSILPLVMHGLADNHRAEYADLDEPSELEEYAKTLMVKLDRTEDGWRFV